MGLWKHAVEQILAVAGMQNQEAERKTCPANINSSKKGRYVQPKQKTRKRGHTFNRFIRRARGRITEERDSSGTLLELRIAPLLTLVDICRASVFLSVS